jgi:flagellar biosynthesis/type III secretory pathway M-ring protein FliF/YscJ
MVDWKQESINSVYHYLLGAILFAVFSFIAKKVLSRFSKKKLKKQQGK